MSITTFYERIQSWLWLYHNVPFPPSDDPVIIAFNDAIARHWKEDVFTRIIELELPPELKGTQAEHGIQSAIAYARLEDRMKLQAIHALLSQVMNYIIDNHLYTGAINSN